MLLLYAARQVAAYSVTMAAQPRLATRAFICNRQHHHRVPAGHLASTTTNRAPLPQKQLVHALKRGENPHLLLLNFVFLGLF